MGSDGKCSQRTAFNSPHQNERTWVSTQSPKVLFNVFIGSSADGGGHILVKSEFSSKQERSSRIWGSRINI